jgi:hypothetical protein
MATSFSGGRSQRTIDHEQATGKLYHLRLRLMEIYALVWDRHKNMVDETS